LNNHFKRSMNSEVEGTPLAGPLPIELQQIAHKDKKEAAAAAAARRKSDEARAAEASDYRRRSSSCGDTVSPDDATTRRSSRAIKRKRFDDEISDMNPGNMTAPSLSLIITSGGATTSSTTPLATPTEPRTRLASNSEPRTRLTSSSSIPATEPSTPVSSMDPSVVNSCQALPDIRQKKLIRDKKRRRGRREGATRDLSRWKPTDDLSLVTAVSQTRDLAAVFRGVKFSCHFSLSEIQERWYTLLYDPVISPLAVQAIRNLPVEIVQKVTSATPFSPEEEAAIAASGLKSTATAGLEEMEKLLSSHAAVFHPSRTGKALLTHWQYMRQYNLLPDQTVQPLPKGDSHQHILNFHDGEEQVVDGELIDPVDGMLNHELSVVDRQAKREIRRLENEVSKWQLVVEQVTGQATPEFDSQTLAVLRGRLVRYLMRSREISVGRATKDQTVDVDLTLEGPATKVSRRQAIIKLRNSGEFHIANEGSRPVLVNGKPVLTGDKARLSNNTVVEFCNLRFVFLINTELIEAIRAEAAKNNFVTNRLPQSFDQNVV